MSVFANHLSANISDQNFYKLRANNNGGNPFQRQLPTTNRKVLEDYFSCSVCSNVFTNIVDLRRHEIEHTGNDVIKLFKEKIALESNALKNKDGNGTQNISVRSSEVNLSRAESLFKEKYESLMVSSKAFHCTHCSDIYTIKKNLVEHMKVDHNVDYYRFTCKVCGIMYSEELSYLRHCKSHEIENSQSITPPMKNDSYGKQSFECRYCCKQFSTKESLKTHIVEHKGNVTPQDNRHRKNSSTRRHSFEMVENNRPKDRLSFHERNTNHQNIKAACFDNNEQVYDEKPSVTRLKNFSKGFAKKESDQQHKNDKQNKVNCPVCNQVFASKSLMIEHQHSHRDSKQYICQNCGEIFWRKRRLIRHETMHCTVLKALNPNMEKSNAPYRCEICHQEFWRKRHYLRHQIYNCEKDKAVGGADELSPENFGNYL